MALGPLAGRQPLPPSRGLAGEVERWVRTGSITSTGWSLPGAELLPGLP